MTPCWRGFGEAPSSSTAGGAACWIWTLSTRHCSMAAWPAWVSMCTNRSHRRPADIGSSGTRPWSSRRTCSACHEEPGVASSRRWPQVWPPCLPVDEPRISPTPRSTKGPDPRLPAWEARASGRDDDLRGLARPKPCDRVEDLAQGQHGGHDRREVEAAALDQPDRGREGEVRDVGAED